MPDACTTLLDESGPSRVDRVGPLCLRIRSALVAVAGLPEGALDRLELAMSEAVTNAILHAHRADPNLPLRVVVRTEGEAQGRRLVIEVHDHGPGLDPQLLKAEPTEGLIEHGRGLFLIRSCVDAVDYERGPEANALRLVCKLGIDGVAP